MKRYQRPNDPRIIEMKRRLVMLTRDYGVKQKVADALGLSHARVSQVLHPDNNVKLETLARMFDVLGYDVLMYIRKRRS